MHRYMYLNSHLLAYEIISKNIIDKFEVMN